jgi:nucleoside-diphosphate-sugar epimerase
MAEASREGEHQHGRRALVTGCAGFIGSTLSERLVDDGWEVVGIDSLNAMYSLRAKLENLGRLRHHERFELRTADLATDALERMLEGVDTVFHLAARPGVRESFGNGFADYARDNVVATQRLLEATVNAAPDLRSFVYASSSSVYGTPTVTPTPETAERTPLSPYGMTKVATEELAALYHRASELPVVGLRYFTVYGPRQRPDMAFSRFIGCALRGEPLRVFGDGRQLRDFTFVADAVEGTLAAAEHGVHGSVYNVGGGKPVALADAIGLLSEALEMPIAVERLDAARGDARNTCADGSKAEQDLGFSPSTPLAHGLRAQVEWAIAGREAWLRSLIAA